MNDTKFWAKAILDKLCLKAPESIRKARKLNGIPYTVKNGQWAEGYGIDWWTNGFWPGLMWLLYRHDPNPLFRLEALRGEALLDKALMEFEKLHHDVGFMWLLSSGAHYAFEGDKDSLRRLTIAGDLLAARYNPNGFIRAWNDASDGSRAGWSIIDTMMNLPLLYAMSRLSGDPRFKMMAIRHAEYASEHFFKPDGSVYHIVIYDPESGKMLDTPAGQGCAPGSSWSRGQSWAIYGYTLSAILSGKKEFLSCAMRVADYFIAHTPEDRLVPVDFCQNPERPVIDNCANAIAASGMIELSEQLKDERPQEAERYLKFAVELLKALDESCAVYDDSIPAVLTRCTGAYSDAHPEYPILYADFFYAEALLKLCGQKALLWALP